MNKKQFNRYIPKALKIELDKFDYPRKDNLYTIIDLIQRKEMFFKSDAQKRHGYAEIPISQFKELIPSSNNLNADMKFLIENKFIIRNDRYIAGVSSKSYKISSEYLGNAIAIKIQDKNINQRIWKQIQSSKRKRVKNLEFAKTEYFKNFKIDYLGSKLAIHEKAEKEIIELCAEIKIPIQKNQINDIINCDPKGNKVKYVILRTQKGIELHNIIHRYMVYNTRLNAINDGFLFFKRNKTNGRLDSNLTSLPSFLRPFIQSNERLMNIDIKNSQPFFLFILIKNNPSICQEELLRYMELVISGTLYDYLKDEYNNRFNKFWDRDQMKKMLFKIYYSKTSSYSAYKDFYSSIFPTIMQFINSENEVFHNTLSVRLQTTESFAVLDTIMPLLEAIGIRPYTIHDSFVCKESEANQIIETIKNKFVELFGYAPALHSNYIGEIEDEDDDEPFNWYEDLYLIGEDFEEEEVKPSEPIIVSYSKEERNRIEIELGFKKTI
jgi:hypothetical protein